MRTVFVLYDSLNRLSLGPYGAKKIRTPNFDRLAGGSVTFDNHYVGSMPCMPARRDMQTGRLNFLHRSWGPMEPYDNSYPEILKDVGTYSHIVTDHLQYFREGGEGYHTRFTTYDHVRGQHADAWKANVDPDWDRLNKVYHPLQYSEERGNDHYHNIINRPFIINDDDFPVKGCFDLALEFLDRNLDADNWFLQLETFAPHEPFHAPERFRKDYPTNYKGPTLDWPPYGRVKESPEECAELDANYCASVAFSDEQLGRLLDCFDEHDLWKDTALVVSTDHGYLMGEHDWWAKNRMPAYEEVTHIPLFVHHPDFVKEAGTRRQSLTQTIDLMPTFLDFFRSQVPEEVQGKSLVQVLEKDQKIREAVIYGLFGSAVNITDGRYTFFLYPEEVSTEGQYQYTLMPTTLLSHFTTEEMAAAELVAPFDFSKGARLLRTPVMPKSPFNKWFGPDVHFDTDTVLFDLAQDPFQEKPYRDAEVEAELMVMMGDLMRQHDAPAEKYKQLGLEIPTNCKPYLLTSPSNQ
jgi:arylsulfatase A-like enzyme